ncbi:hypothetical protein EZ428_02035 [Pedobacter frigiditerrae]|uniref:Uncharacterized protein n=1 Tax=Pedobacter frigiditerrae TaxID=2530452 RepID=A0A4R0N2P1_9SPHI|nr:hypothetical protein [Pedobacter frigiditerrae]TCC93573.1 hypothetical protein EZ428_02035 [Pedobacter frigiditerrae]
MKYFVIFLLLLNTCFAQKIVVKDESGNLLANVSIFLVEKDNSLIGITNNEGFSEISLNKNASYLFHLLGFEDVKLPYSAINSMREIVLKSALNELEDVVVAYAKSNILKIKNTPADRFWSYPNFSNAALNKVIQIKVDSAGFLNKLTFPIKVQDKSNVSDYRFVLFKDDNGKPGKALINESIVGNMDKKKLQFDLKSLNFYLEKGSYFFGFEALTPANFIKREGEQFKKGKWVTVPLVIINSLDTAKTYIRHNLGEWLVETEFKFENGKRTTQLSKGRFLAYELEMLTAVAK